MKQELPWDTIPLKIREDNSLVLALGSNLGDRGEYVKKALEALESWFGKPSRISQIIETQAVGFDGPDFLNCVVQYSEVQADPHEVLKICKEIERNLGREDVPEYNEAGERVYHSRCIDIDILLYGNRVVDTPDLKIPHPGISTRSYLQELLSQLL